MGCTVQHHPHTFHDHGHQGHRSIIQPFDGRDLLAWDYGVSFQADGDCGLLRVSVEDISEYSSELMSSSTFPGTPSSPFALPVLMPCKTCIT